MIRFSLSCPGIQFVKFLSVSCKKLLALFLIGRIFFQTGEGICANSAGSGSPLLEKAKKAYYEFRFSEAEKSLRRLVLEEEGKNQVQGYLFLGLTQLGRGDPKKAAISFREAIRLGPGLTLDPREYPPKAIRLFDQVDRQVAKEVVSPPEEKKLPVEKRKPFYKKPLFWILFLGAAGAGGGIAAAMSRGGGSDTGTLAISFQ